MARSAAPAARPRGNVTLRLRDEVRAAIQKEADARGRSLSEEIETRLERSLLDQQIAIDALDLVYGQRLNDVLISLGRIMKAIVEYSPFYLQAPSHLSWIDYPWKFDHVVRAVNFFFERLRPAGAIEQPPAIGISPPTWISPTERATPGKRAEIRQLHLRAQEIEAEQARHIGTMIAAREIKNLIAGDDTPLRIRDERLAERLNRPSPEGGST